MQIDGQASSLRDDLAAAFAAKEAAASESTTAPEPGATGEGVDPGTDRNESKPDNGTAPAAASAPEKAKEGEPARASEEAKTKDEPKAKEGDGEEPGDLDPPTVWSKEDKEEFYSLPKKAQEILLKRNRSAEAAITKKFQEVSERGRQYDEFAEILKPYEQRIALNGHSPASYVKNVLTVGAYADEKPEEFIRWFAQQRGINLSALTGGIRQPQGMRGQQPGQQAQPQMRVDPVTGQLYQHVGALENRIQQVTGYLEREQQERAARTNAEAVREIEAFANATDEHGNPKFPFFSEVEQEMAALIRSGQVSGQNTLEEAYDRAVWANPATRTKLQEDIQARSRREAQRQEQEKAKAAQKSAASLRGTGGGSPASQDSQPGSDNLRDQLRHAMAQKRSAGVI